MAIRKDLDDMLNNLKIGTEPASPVNKAPAPIAPVHKPSKSEEKIDHMSVDDLLSTLSHEKEEPVQTAAAPVQAAPEQPKKKKIVISGDLPDYETIRQAELEKDRAEAERRRLEAEKQAAEEAERQRLEAAKKAAEEAERQRLEAAKKAAEEAEIQRLEAAKKAAEEAERQRLEAAKKAAEDAEESPAFSFEEEINVVTSSQTEDSLGGEPTVDELMAAAFAAVAAENDADNEAAETADAPEENADAPESDPVGNMIDTIREDAEKKLSELDETPEPEEDALADEETSDKPENEQEDKAEERKKRFFEKKKAGEEAAPAEDAEKPKGKITSALEKIMDEDPDEIIAERSEKTEDDETDAAGGKSLKKRLYTVFGIVFAVLACVGLVTVIATAVKLLGSFTSGDSKKTGFADVVYPAVIMDIESFDEPSQLTSDQVITAAIWSMIMSDGTLDSYEKTFDVVRVPAVDVESYAVKLFGDDLPELTHTTVGPAESRFYYNEEKESYNVPLTPVTFTYSPEIKSVTKSGSEYTLTVDYIDELPEWLPKTSSKSVEFRLIQTSEGYQIKSMKVLSENNNI
ncbi:MAG: hypothetical protein K6G82_00230 [Ruminococcus sp.]|nr:hypothetical protein [Ruminococcus sp.]